MTYGRRDPQVARGIRRVRLERGWTLREVAVLLGCDPSRICRIENGERGTPDPAEAAGKLGVPLSYLMEPCPRCGYQPPDGYLCLRCGTQATQAIVEGVRDNLEALNASLDALAFGDWRI